MKLRGAKWYQIGSMGWGQGRGQIGRVVLGRTSAPASEACSVARRGSAVSRAQAHVGTPAALHTPGAPGYISGSHIPCPLHVVMLTGQDWACAYCLGMCLAE